MATQNHDLLESLFRAAVAAADPSRCLPPALPEPRAGGRLIVLAAGKGAGSLTEVAEAHYLGRMPANRIEGVAVARHGYGRPVKRIAMIEAGHPVPDAAGLTGAERALELADQADQDDLVLVLLSGGASANWIAPAPGITLAEKQAATRALVAERRQYRRNQLRPEASLPHQRRPPRPPRFPGQARDAGDFRLYRATTRR